VFVMKKIIGIFPLLLLSGCYSNWENLDEVSKEITCDMDIVRLEKLAMKHEVLGQYDVLSKTYSMSKSTDVIGIVFNDKKVITVIAKTQSHLSLGGLTRRQGDVVVVKRCVG